MEPQSSDIAKLNRRNFLTRGAQFLLGATVASVIPPLLHSDRVQAIQPEQKSMTAAEYFKSYRPTIENFFVSNSQYVTINSDPNHIYNLNKDLNRSAIEANPAQFARDLLNDPNISADKKYLFFITKDHSKRYAELNVYDASGGIVLTTEVRYGSETYPSPSGIYNMFIGEKNLDMGAIAEYGFENNWKNDYGTSYTHTSLSQSLKKPTHGCFSVGTEAMKFIWREIYIKSKQQGYQVPFIGYATR
jgi:hypothetical protein